MFCLPIQNQFSIILFHVIDLKIPIIMTQEELMNFCLKILGFYGFHPIKRHLFNTILKILQLASSCIVMGLLITEFVVNREKFSVEAYCKCAETFVTVLQVDIFIS